MDRIGLLLQYLDFMINADGPLSVLFFADENLYG